MPAVQLTPLSLVTDVRPPPSAVSPLSANSSARKRKWSHDILASSVNPLTASNTASPSQTFRSLSLRPSAGVSGDEADGGTDAEMDGGKRSRADGGESAVRWVRIQVEQDGGPSIVTHSSPPPPQSSRTVLSFPSSKLLAAAQSTAGLHPQSTLSPPLQSKTSSQPVTLTVGGSSTLSLSPPARPRASTTPVTPTTARHTPLATAAMHLKAADYHAFINSLPSATKKHKRRRPAVPRSNAAAVAPASQPLPVFGPPVPTARIQFTLPSLVLARKAAALAARGGQAAYAESPYAIPSPPPLTSSQLQTPQSHKEEKLDDGSFMHTYASFVSVPSASPVSSISAFSCPSSSPQSVSSSSVTSPMFGPYPFSNLSLSSSTSSISSLPAFHRRFSVPSIMSSSPMSPITTTGGKPPLSRPRSSIHLRHPAIAQRLNKKGGKWRKLQTVLRLNRRWQTYRQAVVDSGKSGQVNGEDEGGVADSEGEQSDDDMDVDDDDIIDEEQDDTVTEEEADSGVAAVSSSSPYNPYAADNRVFVTARSPPPPLQLLQPVDGGTRGVSPLLSRKHPSLLASRRHTNPVNSSSSLLTIASSYIQSKRVPNSPSPLPLPLSPNSPMSPAPKSPSSASLHSRHISMMSAMQQQQQQQQQGSKPSSPSTTTRSLSSLSAASSTSVSAFSSSTSTSTAGLFIDQFALCLILQFCDLRTLLHCKRISWLWYEHASSPLSWLSSRYRLLVAEEGAEQPSTVPLPHFATHLPVTVPSVPRFHALTSSFCDTLTVSVRYLRSLDISSLPFGISVQSLSSLLSAVPFLHTLSLSYNPWLTDGHLQLLPAQLPRLRYLDVSSCPLIHRDGIAPLTQLALLSLDLSSSSLCDDDMDVLAPMTSLLSLNLSCNKHLSSDCMEWLCAAMPQLLILDTSWTTLISASPSMHSPPQHGLSSSSTLLAPVAQLTSLLILNLSYSKHLDDDMLRSVRCCHSLHTLDLFSCQEVTDRGLGWLCGADDSGGLEEQQQRDKAVTMEGQREGGEVGADVEHWDARGTQPSSPTSFPINFAFASPRLLQSAPPSPPLLSSSRASSIGTLALPLSSFTLSSRPDSPVMPRRVLSASSSGASAFVTPARSSTSSAAFSLSSSCPLPSLASLSIGAIPLLSSSAIGACLPLLPSLIAVDLQFTRVEDATLIRLSEGWRRRADKRQAVMRSVQCSWCKDVTEEARERMREQLPHCQVN